jgi:DNA-binding FadR family transcriptional regulator
MAPLPQIESRRLYRQIAELIEKHIDAGEFPPGSFLPPERELAQQLGVSRASVREALIALEVEGRVSVRVGNGVTVLPTAPAPNAGAAAGDSSAHWPEVGPLELLEARRLVECETAALAAKNATDQDVAELEDTLAQMEAESRENEPTHPGDRRFHLKIAEMSGNQALVRIVTMLWDQRGTALFEKFEEHFVTRRLFEDTARAHQLILDAIRARDGKAARTAMRQHLDGVRKAFSREM